MSQTISFVASDELAEYLEEEAERRMTTVSSTAQMLLAEQITGGETQEKTDSSTRKEVGPDVLERHPDAWYEPKSKQNDYAVRVPEDADIYDAGKTRYFQTRQGAAQALKRWYE